MLASRLCLRAASRSCVQTLLHPLNYRYRGAIRFNAKRVFATTPQHRKVEARIATPPTRHDDDPSEQKQPAEENVQTESLEKKEGAKAATRVDPLLAEQTVSNKEQRAADWRIIKNMVQYIWPKDDFGTRFRVGLSVGLLIGAKVRSVSPLYYCVHSLCIQSTGPQRPGPLLLQVYCRLHEH